MNGKALRSVLILFMIGTFVSATQVSSGTAFKGDEDFDLGEMVLSPPVFTGEIGSSSYHCAPDTMETIEIELEKDTGKNIYKEVAMVAVISAFAFFVIKTVFFGEEEETETDTGGGKDIPSSTTFVVFNP